MSSVSAQPRRGYGDVIAVWVLSVVVALAVGMVAPAAERAAWLPVGWGFCVVVAFVIQLSSGRPDGFLARTAASIVGAFAAMGLIFLGFSIAVLFVG